MTPDRLAMIGLHLVAGHYPARMYESDATPHLDISELVSALSASLARERALTEALGHCVAMIENATDGLETEDGVCVAGFTDVQLTPGGSYMISQARALLPSSKD